jgi:rhodanese-related sulfurtransferase
MGQKLFWLIINGLIRCRFPYIHHISIETLHQWLEQSELTTPLLLDARTLSEYNISHLYQAQPVSEDLDSLESYLNLTQNRPIVVYCSIGYRSALMVKQIQNKGKKDVFNLNGSLFQWVTNGYKVYQGKQVVKQIHPYNNTWQWLLIWMLSDYRFIKNKH